jgi:hypothetical protein
VSIDLVELDAKIRDLQDLRRMASNPEMAELLEGLVSKKSNHAKRLFPEPSPRAESPISDEAGLTVGTGLKESQFRQFGRSQRSAVSAFSHTKA